MLDYNPKVKLILHKKAIAGLKRGQNSFEGGCSSELAFAFCKFMEIIGNGGHHFPKYNNKFKDRLIVISKENIEEIEYMLSGRIIKTEGHTSDSISLLHNEGVLFCGDATMNGLPSIHKITIWIENKEAYIKSWKRIIRLKPKIIAPSYAKYFKYELLIKNGRLLVYHFLIIYF